VPWRYPASTEVIRGILKKLFGVLMVISGLKMTGVFDWMGGLLR